MNDMQSPDQHDDLPDGLARVVRAPTLVHYLDQHCGKARQGGGSAYPSAVGWVRLDDMTTHREQIGFSGLEKLMRAIHERIRVQLDSGDITARFGLDDIGVFLDSQAGERNYEQTAEPLRKAISNNLIEIGEDMISATVSIAIQPVREDLKPAEKNLVLVASAAEKMSSQGGNRCGISSGQSNGDVESRGTLLGQLTKALRDNTLKVVFQPLLATSGPERDRFQLLPRLTASDGTLIPAARFIPIAARRGVLPALDNWMVAHAIGLLKKAAGSGATPRLFLNQSPALIDDSKFLDWLQAEISGLESDQRRLVLEFNILELKPRLRQSRQVLQKIRELGIEVSISGIDETVPAAVLLTHLPADYLRMKADFARRLLADDALALRFQEFAHDARKAERKLIVPMLEDAEEVSRIWQMEVDLIQGNFIEEASEHL
ncbi:MAG: EAL domain-containing protein [Wenzhouxiangellaceae bacterium]|nr:EAL domain-containing protein [Wenzhouxiangellaceae bacterium]